MPRSDIFKVRCNGCSKVIEGKKDRFIVIYQTRENKQAPIKNNIREHYHKKCYNKLTKGKIYEVAI